MLVIAHRGASAEAPENTVAAFKRALDTHADAIEIDIMQVEDEIYVFHDRYLRRLAAQPGRFIDLSKAQVAALRIFSQHPVPTLKETIALIRGRCLLNIELKSDVDLELLAEHLRDAESEHAFNTETLLVSSFNHHWLQTLKQLLPELRIGALTAGCPLGLARFAEDLQAWSVHIDIGFVTQAFVSDAHSRGLQVFVYTVDEPEDIQFMRDIGVDGIFTNHPQHTRNVLLGHTNKSPYGI
ncbi:glycerophosphodiester phosphodiesterase [Aliidiomarina iranensis]|uniref:Glycerophosphodiester phosphodiesterase n=1 Tax=Aliidiomarina iranensis TaxID=1434071 RepID=A0A432VRT3_9GAMM|nr:glycerophosphodiester phosphodiesterase [Aliidiomarina iranensis]RUO19022.1 glycerophosphodiester phosphodiesterase [Aliidiomarina iranensis]